MTETLGSFEPTEEFVVKGRGRVFVGKCPEWLDGVKDLPFRSTVMIAGKPEVMLGFERRGSRFKVGELIGIMVAG